MVTRSAIGDIYPRLCLLAGVDPNGRPQGGQHAIEFECVLNALQQIGNAKVDSYGDSRMLVESTDYDTKMLYSDLHRKHIRINELMGAIKRRVWNPDACGVCRGQGRDSSGLRCDACLGGGKSPDVAGLMETFSDLAVYAARGIQILRRLEEKGMVADGARADHGQ